MMWPVFEFRPLPTSFRRGYGIRRYADGAWINDDGEYDLAFIADGQCFYFQPPYHRNIMCSWLTGHWTGHQSQHPGGNPWHYALRTGETNWGGTWDRTNHPNEIAGRSGMDRVCSEKRSASGFHVELHADDPIIAAGLLRERESKKPFEWPRGMTCMYCGATAPIGVRSDAA